MQHLLSLLEIKIRALIDDRKALSLERDALAQKVLELQDKVDEVNVKLSTLKSDDSMREEDAVLASLVVEDLLQIIEEAEQKNNNHMNVFKEDS